MSGKSSDVESQAKALLVARAALEKHAERVVVIDLRTLSNVTDFFVVCTAGSSPQLTAIKDHIETLLAQQGQTVWHTEGTATSTTSSNATSDLRWLLLDCGDVVVHLLDQHARTFYRLEELWADAPRIPVPALEAPLVKPSGKDSQGLTRTG